MVVASTAIVPVRVDTGSAQQGQTGRVRRELGATRPVAGEGLEVVFELIQPMRLVQPGKRQRWPVGVLVDERLEQELGNRLSGLLQAGSSGAHLAEPRTALEHVGQAERAQVVHGEMVRPARPGLPATYRPSATNSTLGASWSNDAAHQHRRTAAGASTTRTPRALRAARANARMPATSMNSSPDASTTLSPPATAVVIADWKRSAVTRSTSPLSRQPRSSATSRNSGRWRSPTVTGWTHPAPVIAGTSNERLR